MIRTLLFINGGSRLQSFSIRFISNIYSFEKLKISFFHFYESFKKINFRYENSAFRSLHRVSPKGWDLKDDFRYFRNDNFKVNLGLLPWIKKYKEADSIKSVHSSLKSHPLWVKVKIWENTHHVSINWKYKSCVYKLKIHIMCL